MFILTHYTESCFCSPRFVILKRLFDKSNTIIKFFIFDLCSKKINTLQIKAARPQAQLIILLVELFFHFELNLLNNQNCTQ